MKRLIILLTIFNWNFAFTQTSFISKYGENYTEAPTCIEQIGQNYYTGHMCSETESLKWSFAKISKLNSKGQLISEKAYPNESGGYCNFERIHKLNDSEFLLIGAIKQANSPNAQIWVVKMDTTLNVIWDKKFMTNRPFTGNLTCTENSAGNIVIGLTLVTDSPQNYWSLFFLETTKEGDSIRSKSLTNGNPNFNIAESILYMDGYYKVFVRGYHAYTNNDCFTQVLHLDENLNMTEVRPVPHSIDINMTAAKISSDEYYLTGNAYRTGLYLQVVITKFDTFENTLAYNEAGSPGNSVDYTAWKQCMAIADSNSIYTGGTGNDNGNFYACHENYMKAMMLSNYDSELNCRWTYFYGSDTACYTMSTMDATSDGGCVMAGIYYDPSRPEKMLDVIVIKVDRTGIITGTKGVQDITSRNAIVFPNPGNDRVCIKSGPQIAGSRFVLHTISGQVVSTISLNGTDEQLSTKNLAPGVYPWSIIKDGKLIEQGKWIKQQ